MPVITISSDYGTGGPEVGERLAQHLGLDYMDKEIIHRIALGLDVPPERVEEFEEGRHNRLRSFLSNVFDFDALKRNVKTESSAPESPSYDDREEIPYDFQVKGWIDRDIYRQMVVKVITALGNRGGAVIKGRGGQCILKNSPRTLHVRFVADLEDRIARTARKEGLPEKKAREEVREMDEKARDFVQSYFGCDPADPAHYHLVLNTSRFSPDLCLQLLETAVRGLFPQNT